MDRVNEQEMQHDEDGEAHGYSVQHWGNGKVSTEQNYKHGLRYGLYISYNMDGNVLTSDHDRNDVLFGSQITYDYDYGHK